MKNFIKSLTIVNFKSIKHLDLNCKRINIFIGKPNVGKSNILEGLGLFSVPYLYYTTNLQSLIRAEKTSNLLKSDGASTVIYSLAAIIITVVLFIMLLNYDHSLR